MRKFIVISIVFIHCLPLFAQEKILFIGNSLTYFNNMPALFQSIAADKGRMVEIAQHTPGGTGFIHHVDNNEVYNLFSSEQWDAVVLQPGSSESAGVSSNTQETIMRGQRLIDSIRAYSPCAKIILYEISNGIAPNQSGGGDYAHYFETQSMIKDTIKAIANGLQIPFAPAGECFRMYYEAHQDLALHNSYNDIHPNLNGSYLVACSIFNTLYQDSVQVCAYYNELEPSLALELQNISDQLVLSNKPEWLINVFNLHADFTYAINGLELQLLSTSEHYDSLQWNVNDEFTSTDSSFSYTFDSSGEKTISLRAYKNTCSETKTKSVNLSELSIRDELFSQYSIQPNPVHQYIQIRPEIQGNFSFSIFDISGKMLLSEQKTSHCTIDVGTLHAGMYILLLQCDKGLMRLNFIKN